MFWYLDMQDGDSIFTSDAIGHTNYLLHAASMHQDIPLQSPIRKPHAVLEFRQRPCCCHVAGEIVFVGIP